MARLPRLAVPGLPHMVVQRGHNRQPVFVDDADREAFVAALREACHRHALGLHAWALLADEVWLLATPGEGADLGRAMQVLGRRYVGPFNQRHGRRGTLWEGRYRAAVIEADAWLVDAVVVVDTAPLRAGLAGAAADWPWSTAAHHLGRRRDPSVVDHPALWALGNTPFEREAAYRQRLEAGLPPERTRALVDAAMGGWPLGGAAFLAQLGRLTERPVVRRPRGRPPKASAT